MNYPDDNRSTRQMTPEELGGVLRNTPVAPVSREPQVAAQLDNLESAIKMVFGVLSDVEERLAPVMRPVVLSDLPATVRPRMEEYPSEMCDLARRIASLREGAVEARDRIIGIVQRLEV